MHQKFDNTNFDYYQRLNLSLIELSMIEHSIIEHSIIEPSIIKFKMR